MQKTRSHNLKLELVSVVYDTDAETLARRLTLEVRYYSHTSYARLLVKCQNKIGVGERTIHFTAHYRESRHFLIADTRHMHNVRTSFANLNCLPRAVQRIIDKMTPAIQQDVAAELLENAITFRVPDDGSLDLITDLAADHGITDVYSDMTVQEAETVYELAKPFFRCFRLTKRNTYEP